MDILVVPPLQVLAILRAHARRWLDRRLIKTTAEERGTYIASARGTFTASTGSPCACFSGEKTGQATAIERRAAEVIVCNGFWDDRRRWLAGYAGHGICRACNWEEGSPHHILHGHCEAMHFARVSRKLLGGDVDLPIAASQVEWMPLTSLGWPPLEVKWSPSHPRDVEGFMDRDLEGDFHGDGSGFNQEDVTISQAAWSVVRLTDADMGADPSVHQAIRQLVPGWFRNSARAELMAAAAAVERSALNAAYVGDCSHVITGCSLGVPPTFLGSGSINADIWRRLARAVRDRDGQIAFVKTKAHRSRGRAEIDISDGLLNWHGNQAADAACKELAAAEAAAHDEPRMLVQTRELCARTLEVLAFAGGWAFQHMPDSLHAKANNRKKVHSGTGSEDFIGQHVTVARSSGGRICTVCRLSSWSTKGNRTLAMKPCRGDLASQAHPTHILDVTGGILWCRRCGAYTSRVPRALREACQGRPRTIGQGNVWRRLHDGLPPTTSALHERLAEEAARVPPAMGDHGVAHDRAAHVVHRPSAHHPPHHLEGSDAVREGARAVDLSILVLLAVITLGGIFVMRLINVAKLFAIRMSDYAPLRRGTRPRASASSGRSARPTLR